MPRPVDIWLAAGVRTPFAKVDGPLGDFDALQLSVPVARHMVASLNGAKPDFAVWGAVVPSLLWSNIAREVLMDAGIDATVPAYSTAMACSPGPGRSTTSTPPASTGCRPSAPTVAPPPPRCGAC